MFLTFVLNTQLVQLCIVVATVKCDFLEVIDLRAVATAEYFNIFLGHGLGPISGIGNVGDAAIFKG
ncbi:hypothetical protein D3C80_1033630 [compost metagenome]